MSLARRILPIGEPFNNELSVKFEENLAFPTWAEGTYYTNTSGVSNNHYSPIYRNNFNGYLLASLISNGNHRNMYLSFYVYDDEDIAHEIQFPFDLYNDAYKYGWDGSYLTIPIAKGVRWQIKPFANNQGARIEEFTFVAAGEVPAGATIIEEIEL